MAGLPWYQQEADFSARESTVALCELLGDRNAGMYVIRLREHCSWQALDGRISRLVVEGAAGWMKRRGKFIAAAVEARVLRAEGEAFVLIEWEQRNGARIRKWQADNLKPRGNLPASPEEPSEVPLRSPAGPERDQRGTGGGFQGVPGVEDERQEKKELRSRQTDGSETTEPPPPAPVVRLAGRPGDEDLLDDFRDELGARLGLLGAVALGKDPGAALAQFKRWIATYGRPAVLDVAVEVANRCKDGKPQHLTWWPGWMKNEDPAKFLAARERHAPIPTSEVPCWGEALAYARGRSTGEGKKFLHRYLEQLAPHMEGDTLVLVARSAFDAEYLADKHVQTVEELLRELNHELRVRFDGPAPVAAGGAA